MTKKYNSNLVEKIFSLNKQNILLSGNYFNLTNSLNKRSTQVKNKRKSI